MLRVARSCSSFSKTAIRGRFYSQPWFSYNNLQNNVLDFPEQKVFAGTESLAAFAKSLKSTSTKKPLIVTDTGLVKAGVPDLVIPHLSREGFTPVVTDKSQPNPSCEDVINLAKDYLQGGCDSFIGIGGGGPVDAMKIAAVLATQAKVDKNFKLERDGTEFVVSKMMPLLRSGSADFEKAFPGLYAIPTTAGTGSEGGKSSVIVDPTGQKRVYGHPLLMPKLVALDPQLTAKLPPALTAATGIDALAHLLEAWFVPAWTVLVPEEGGTSGGYLTTEQIERCDRFALEGIELVVKSLPAAFKNGSDLSVRLQMQIAALFGAKAFRKGDLGGIHAAAHALGAHYHLHHGTAISRMMVPVLSFNEAKARGALVPRFQAVLDIFNRNGYKSESLAKAMELFLKQFAIPNGLKELKVTKADLEKVSELASTDPCQTNPVPLAHEDYVKIFNTANE